MRALLVLWHWPPSGGPGVQRGVKLCRDLRAFGIEPEVLTVEEEAHAGPDAYDPDPSLAGDVPPDLHVVRTPAGGGRALRRALARLRLLRAARHVHPGAFFERQAAWFAPLRSALLDRIDAARPDVLLTSSQPYVAHLAGRAAALGTGVPWVADFRDPWSLSWGAAWPSRRAFAWEERREEEVLADADVVVANTPGARRECLERRPWLDPRKVVVARNGYDPADFRDPPARRAAGDGEVVVVHAGSFRARAPGRGRRGARAALDRREFRPVPYDLSTHSPTLLFRALAAPGAPRARVRLVGSLDPGWIELARAMGLGSRVEAVGYRPHRETTAEMLGAGLLWLPAITRTDGGRVSNVPAKTYEYLGSGRPVLAAAGPGDTADTVAGRDRCVVAGPDDLAAVAEALGRAADGSLRATEPDPPDARRYRREETARAMAAALRQAVAARRPPPRESEPAGPALDPGSAPADTSPSP